MARFAAVLACMIPPFGPPLVDRVMVGMCAQFLGDTHTIQELEDYGELEDALAGSD